MEIDIKAIWELVGKLYVENQILTQRLAEYEDIKQLAAARKKDTNA